MNVTPKADDRPTVLCVDDERSVLTALERLLCRDGWRVLTADNGSAALELLARERIDVLICDHAMPGIPGTDVLRRARDLSPDTVRILLTAHWTRGELVLPAINEAEVFRVFPKPWDDEQIRDAVAKALGTDALTWTALRQRAQGRLRGPASPASQGTDAHRSEG